jgi:group I intron endonuclease
MATKTSGIYIIVNIKSKKVYLGQSQNIRTRWITHKRSLQAGTHYNLYLQRAWLKYGAESFKFQVLEYCPVEQLDEREQHFLDIYIEQGLCYNIAIDATAPMRGRTHVHSEATKHKMSEIAKGKVFSIQHRQHLSVAQRNKPPASAETRRKISDAVKSRPPMSDETRRKMSVAAKNRVHHPLSDETRRKISIAQKGKTHPPLSAETRIKIGLAGKGRRHTPEARLKISEASKNISDETRKKRSESMKAAWAKRKAAQNDSDT